MVAARIRHLDPNHRLRRSEVQRLREATQVILELGLSEVTRAEITNAVYRREKASEPSPRWTFVMISPDQVRLVMRLIQERVRRPDTTHRVFIAALTHVRVDTG